MDDDRSANEIVELGDRVLDVERQLAGSRVPVAEIADVTNRRRWRAVVHVLRIIMNTSIHTTIILISFVIIECDF